MTVPYAVLESHGLSLHQNLLSKRARVNLEAYRDPVVKLNNIERGGSIATYDIVLGPFTARIILLFVPDASHNVVEADLKLVGEGAFATVHPILDGKKRYVAKSINYTGKRYIMRMKADGVDWWVPIFNTELATMLVEVALTKICSMLGVGPKVRRDLGFDAVCF